MGEVHSTPPLGDARWLGQKFDESTSKSSVNPRISRVLSALKLQGKENNSISAGSNASIENLKQKNISVGKDTHAAAQLLLQERLFQDGRTAKAALQKTGKEFVVIESKDLAKPYKVMCKLGNDIVTVACSLDVLKKVLLSSGLSPSAVRIVVIQQYIESISADRDVLYNTLCSMNKDDIKKCFGGLQKDTQIMVVTALLRNSSFDALAQELMPKEFKTSALFEESTLSSTDILRSFVLQVVKTNSTDSKVLAQTFCNYFHSVFHDSTTGRADFSKEKVDAMLSDPELVECLEILCEKNGEPWLVRELLFMNPAEVGHMLYCNFFLEQVEEKQSHLIAEFVYRDDNNEVQRGSLPIEYAHDTKVGDLRQSLRDTYGLERLEILRNDIFEGAWVPAVMSLDDFDLQISDLGQIAIADPIFQRMYILPDDTLSANQKVTKKSVNWDKPD